MSDEDDPTKGEEDMGFRGRGRPRLPSDMKRRETLTVKLTATELRQYMLAAANHPDGPLKVQDWARRVLGEASKVTSDAETDPLIR